MINKQNLWFLTLCSLILVLGVYYVTMPNELLLTNSKTEAKEENTESQVEEKTTDVNYYANMYVLHVCKNCEN